MRLGRIGFTMIELLLVVVILGLLVGFVAPRIDVTKFKVESAMQAVGTTLLATERLAITEQHDVIVQFDTTNQRMRIHEDANNNGVIDPGEHVRAVPLGEAIVFGRGAAPAMPGMGPGPVTFTKLVGGLPALVFHRDGSASEAAGLYLTSQRAATTGTRPQDARAIQLDRGTGRASWYRYGPPAWQRAF
jgi:prepilin-type N-terminal cleavage/methylation domain-containing protein